MNPFDLVKSDCAIALSTISGVMPNVLIFCTFNCNQYSFVLPPVTRTSDTPFTWLRNGRMVVLASNFNSIGERRLLASEYPITGRIEGFILATLICTSGGRLFLISAIFDSIRCWLRSISAFQLMNAEISHVPLLVVLLIISR